MNVKALLAHNVKLARKNLEYSQMKLAELCEITPHYVAEIEAAKKYPSAQTLERLSDALKISPSELFADVTSGATAFQRHKEMTALSRELRAELNGRIDAVTKKHLSPPSRDSRE